MWDEGAVRVLLATGKCNLLAEDGSRRIVFDYLAREQYTREEILNPPPVLWDARQGEGFLLPATPFGDHRSTLLHLLLERGIDVAGRPQANHGCLVRLRDMVRLPAERARWDGLVAASVGVPAWRRRRAAVVAAAPGLVVV
jgi:hypothetical protein